MLKSERVNVFLFIVDFFCQKFAMVHVEVANEDVGLHLFRPLGATFLAVPKMEEKVLGEDVDGLVFSLPQMGLAVRDISVRLHP